MLFSTSPPLSNVVDFPKSKNSTMFGVSLDSICLNSLFAARILETWKNVHYKGKKLVICRNARKRCHMTRNIVYCMPMKMIDCVHTHKRGRGLVSRYHRNFHMNPQFKQEILTAQNKLNQVCCNCMDLFCLFLVQHPLKKISSICRRRSGTEANIELPCESIFLVFCENLWGPTS